MTPREPEYLIDRKDIEIGRLRSEITRMHKERVRLEHECKFGFWFALVSGVSVGVLIGVWV